MKRSSFLKAGVAAAWMASTAAHAIGVLPEASVVVVEQSTGEGAINVKNTDAFVVLLLTTLINTRDDTDNMLIVTPPAARVEPGKTQRVRFIMTSREPLKTERLKHVTFDGVPPQQKGKSEVSTTAPQNLPVIIRPSCLIRDLAPWEHLTWKVKNDSLTVSNPSPYVVRLAQGVQTLPDNTTWTLPNDYVLPGQTLTVKVDSHKTLAAPKQVRISPATTGGYAMDTYEATLSQ